MDNSKHLYAPVPVIMLRVILVCGTAWLGWE